MDTPKFFRSVAELRKWLKSHHADTDELWFGFYKKGSSKKSVTYREALDEALCFGWIDGVRKSIDDSSYKIRFTPRKARSIWSEVNIKRAGELIELGRMQPPGLKAFEARDESLTKRYSYERENSRLSPTEQKLFKTNRKAWDYFNSQPPSYQKTVIWWVVSAEKEETRKKRFDSLIRHSAKGERQP